MGVAADLQSLRTRYQSIATSTYDERCSVSRVTQTDDGRGGWDESPLVVIASDIPCALVPYKTGQREIVIAGKPKGMADGDVWLPALFNGSALDVNEADRIIIAANGSEAERTLEIIFPAPHQGIIIQAAVRLVNA